MDKRCSCSKHDDGSVTTSRCSVHAENDPCETMAQVTGKRRKGSIVRGCCSNCGWTAMREVEKVETVHYVCRDIGYGVEEGFAHGSFTGERDTWGKLTFEPIGGETLYLFSDEIVSREPATLEAVKQAAFMSGYRTAKAQVLAAL